MTMATSLWRVRMGLASVCVASACAAEDTPADDAAMHGSTDGESSAGEGMSAESSSVSADGTSSEESGDVPSTCPADIGDAICSEGDSCEHGDFDCECVCGCDEDGEFGGDGYYECSYARAEELLTVTQASTVLDCDTGMIATTATFVVDNVDGVGAIEIGMSGPHSTRLTVGDAELACSGLCSDGEPCPDGERIAVAAGATAELVHQFGPASCLEPEGGADLCSFCGATGVLAAYWGLTGSRKAGSGLEEVEVTVTCP